MDQIKLVSGDNRPYIRLTLNDINGSPINLSGATVNVYFRAAGTTAILATLACTLVSGGTGGQCTFNFPGTALNVPAGQYEGEITISFGSEVQTVYDVLKFYVRSQFA
jgi:hypothetical protein